MFHVPMKMETCLTSGSRLCMFFNCCTSWQKFSRCRTSSNMYVFFLRPVILMSRRQLFAEPLISCSTAATHEHIHNLCFVHCSNGPVSIATTRPAGHLATVHTQLNDICQVWTDWGSLHRLSSPFQPNSASISQDVSYKYWRLINGLT